MQKQLIVDDAMTGDNVMLSLIKLGSVEAVVLV